MILLCFKYNDFAIWYYYDLDMVLLYDLASVRHDLHMSLKHCVCRYPLTLSFVPVKYMAEFVGVPECLLMLCTAVLQ
jgi:hypothetical protein